MNNFSQIKKSQSLLLPSITIPHLKTPSQFYSDYALISSPPSHSLALGTSSMHYHILLYALVKA
jgi:hypothetical protein